MGEMAEALLGHGADAGDVDQRQIVRALATEEALLQCVEDGFGGSSAADAAG